MLCWRFRAASLTAQAVADRLWGPWFTWCCLRMGRSRGCPASLGEIARTRHDAAVWRGDHGVEAGDSSDSKLSGSDQLQTDSIVVVQILGDGAVPKLFMTQRLAQVSPSS